MKIISVNSKKEIRDFIQFPYVHYKKDTTWVPPLRREERKTFNPKSNPLLRHCEWQLFLLEKDGEVVGRVAAFIDLLAIEFWGEKVGFFGYYECIDDSEASKMLLETCKKWLIDKGCSKMWGPWSFVSQEWGAVVEGFKPSPVIMGPYNPPYYNDHFLAYGLVKVKDMLCWYISGEEGYQIPERIQRLTDKVAQRYGIHIRTLDMKNYREEVNLVLELSNESIINNWGFSPVTEDEVVSMANDLRDIIQPRGVLFAEDKMGNAIGFAIALPDINYLIKNLNGRLFPWGLFKLFLGIPRLRRYRMFALGVVPDYQGKGIDSLLYKALNESLFTPDLWMEINYVLEDNWPMINAIKKLNATPLRRYRVYEKVLS